MLLERIQKKDAKIGVIGLGYVGLPLVIEFCKSGFSVTGLDIDEKKIEALSKGKSFIKQMSLYTCRQSGVLSLGITVINVIFFFGYHVREWRGRSFLQI